MADRESAAERTDDLPVVSADAPPDLFGAARTPALSDDGPHAIDRDPTALAAWRRVAEQRRRRLQADISDAPGGLPGGPVGSDDGAGGSDNGAGGSDDGAGGSDAPGTAAAPVSAGPASTAPLGEPSGGSAEDVEHPAPTARPDRHEVLLGLAGRVDDDALSAVRELVAVEDSSAAAELLGGCLLAGRVGVTSDERGALDGWFAGARVDPELVAALPTDPEGARRSVHRFAAAVPAGSSAPSGRRRDGETVARVAARLPGVHRVRQCWRLTPAGSAPGPVPHRVVLVETDSVDDRENVTHHVAHAARALGTVSVEVFATGATLPTYHREALAVAMPLTPEGPAGEAPSGVPRHAPASMEPDRPEEPEVADLGREAAAERIAALWAQPSAVDVFDAPLSDPLEPTGLEPARPHDEVEPDTPTGGFAALGPGSDSVGSVGSGASDLGRVRRARHSRGGDDGGLGPDDVDPDASASPAGPFDALRDHRLGRTWGNSTDGRRSDPLLASPVEIGLDPLAGPSSPTPDTGQGGEPWADPTPTDPTLRRSTPPPSTPPPSAPPPSTIATPAASRPADDPRTPSEWNARLGDTSEGAASQLSDRERELLARLHEELAARERLDPYAADPLTRSEPDPRTDDQLLRPTGSPHQPPVRRNGYVNGHVNGHDLPRRYGPSAGQE